MEFWFSQICGLIVSVAAIASMQLSNITYILFCQLICNGVGALSYIAVGGLSGCGIYLVALSQAIIYYILRKKFSTVPQWIAGCFICAYILCAVSTYKTPTDLISALASLTCALSLVQKKPSGYRLFMLFNGIIWMIYDFSVGAYTMIISHVATALSAAVGMIRLDLKRNTANKG
ncbi:MAG: YgjV family protein [Clostridia bacterium]|nr:YgjV family protein [Clostridia bacterium]